MDNKFEDKKKEKLEDYLNLDTKTAIFSDQNQKNKKGNENKDIRFDPNKNDKELDIVSKKNLLR